MMEKSAQIYIAGHRGLVGSALMRGLQSRGYQNLIVEGSDRLDLRRQDQTEKFFEENRPEFVFLAAGWVGGIHANNLYRGKILYDNLILAANVIQAAYLSGVKKLLNLGSSCVYPRLCPQPMREEYLLTGALEPTNEPYAVAKIAALKLTENYSRQYGCNFFSVMPTNLFGPGDNFDLEHSHVIPSMIRKFYEAKSQSNPQVEFWGDGSPRRDFLFVDDLAAACIQVMETINASDLPHGFCNIGSGQEITLLELSRIIQELVGYCGQVAWDTSKPNGMPAKRVDCHFLNSRGWQPRISLQDGLLKTYQWYLQHLKG